MTAAAVLATLLLGEVVARLWLEHVATTRERHQFASFETLAAERDRLYVGHRYLGYMPTPGLDRNDNLHNRLGFRGEEIEMPKPAGEFRIACVGGSTTYSTTCSDYTASYPYRLQEILRASGRDVTVINGGVGGWTSWETLISFATRVVDLDPDLVIFHHGINDVHPRLVWPPEAYLGDNSGARQSPLAVLRQPTWTEKSALARIILIRAGWLDSNNRLTRFYDAAPPTFFGYEFQRQIRNGVYPAGVFEEADAARMFEVNRPTFFRRNLEHLIAIARFRGIGVTVATFAYCSDFPDEPRVSTPEYVRAIAETNQVVRDVARESGVDLFDFARVFPDDASLYADGRHLFNEGIALKARFFAEHLEGSGLLPDR